MAKTQTPAPPEVAPDATPDEKLEIKPDEKPDESGGQARPNRRPAEAKPDKPEIKFDGKGRWTSARSRHELEPPRSTRTRGREPRQRKRSDLQVCQRRPESG